jgi:hypothetical protein
LEGREVDRTVSLQTHCIQQEEGMKNTISTILAIAGAIALALLFGGGLRMSGLASQSGGSVAEYYYRAMGTCMIGFSFVAAGLLWGLSWMVAAWPDNEGILAALNRKDSSSHINSTSPSPSESIRPAAMGEWTQKPSTTSILTRPLTHGEIESGHQPFYGSLASVDPAAPGVVQHLLSWFNKGRADGIVWSSGQLVESVTVYVRCHGASVELCTVQSNGTIAVHFESLNSNAQVDAMHLGRLRQLAQAISGTAFRGGPPFEPLTVSASVAGSPEVFSNLVSVLQELIGCLKYS